MLSGKVLITVGRARRFRRHRHGICTRYYSTKDFSGRAPYGWSDLDFTDGNSEERRQAAFEGTFAFRQHGPKPRALVIHPLLPGTGRKPTAQVLWEAEEAIALARANRWDILPGPNGTPRGGWDEKAFEAAEAREDEREAQRKQMIEPGTNSGSALVVQNSLEPMSESDAEFAVEYDLDEEVWACDVIRRQWAETCIIKIRHIAPATLFGKGKIQELALYVAQNPCRYVFINCNLTATQSRNLETLFRNAVRAAEAERRRQEERSPVIKNPPTCEVIDRNRLILDIFDKRARTPMARAQAGMARIEYMKSRLVMGTRARLRQALQVLHENVGPFKEVMTLRDDVEINFEYEAKPFETERNLLRVIERKLKGMLEVEKKNRLLQRRGRAGVPLIGIVGYTNVGKTSLINQLTGSELPARNLLFDTLDTTMRRVRLPSGGYAIVADSIGFIQDLPHNVFTAYQSTLDELLACDILIHVVDITHPYRDKQRDVVLATLRNAGISEDKLQSSLIEVWNKVDLLPSDEMAQLWSSAPPGIVPLSAADGAGVEGLLHVLDVVVDTKTGQRTRSFTFLESEMPRALAFLHRHGCVDQESLIVKDGHVNIKAVVSPAAWQSWQAAFEPTRPKQLLDVSRDGTFLTQS